MLLVRENLSLDHITMLHMHNIGAAVTCDNE